MVVGWGGLWPVHSSPIHVSATTTGHDCWATPWLNDTDYCLWELHEDEDPDMPIRPGRAVVLTWEGNDYGFTWAYRHHHKEEA